MINGFTGKNPFEYVGQIQVQPGKTGFLDLPADKVIKAIHWSIRGRTKLTYSAGTPVIHHMGIAGGLIKKISVQRKGGDDLRTYLGVHKLVNDQKLQFTDRGALLYKGNAATLGLATSSDNYVVPTSGQDMSFYEAYPIYMENRKSLEYWRTYYSTLGNKSSKIIFDFNSWLDILDSEDASTITSIEGDAVIEVYISTVDHLIGASNSFEDTLDSFDQIVLPGIANSSRYTISPEGELQGFWIRAVKGAKEVRFTHEDMLNTIMEFKFDGQTILKANLLDMAAFNMHDQGLLDVIRGASYVNLLNSRTWRTGLFTGTGANTKYIEVFITCAVTGAKFYFEYDRVSQRVLPEVAKK